MGHGSSRSGESSSLSTPSSRVTRLRQKLHDRRHRKRDGKQTTHSKLLHSDDFAGIALVNLISAEMKLKDKWLACISFGEQTFRTAISDHTSKPAWNSEKKLLLEKNGPHIARISVFETNKVSKNNIVGYCEIDLFEFLTRVGVVVTEEVCREAGTLRESLIYGKRSVDVVGM